MTCKNIAVICENERGEVYQVALTENESKAIEGLIRQMHGEALLILPKRIYGIEITNKKTT